MKYFDDLESYREYVEDLPSSALRDILHSIDGERYPERRRIVEEALRARDTGRAAAGTPEDPDRIPFGIAFLRVAYILLMGVAFLGLFIQLVQPPSPERDLLAAGSAAALMLYGIITFGLWKAHAWTVILIWVWSILGLFASFARLAGITELGVVEQIEYLLAAAILIPFLAFQFYVFTRVETLRFFRFAGVDLL